MTTFQDPPLSRRAVRQNERDQAEPDATSIDAAAQTEAPAEPLTYATQSRPPVPEYDGPSFRVRAAPAGDAPDAVDPASAPSEGGYRPRDFSPEGRRASGSPSWAPQYGGVGDDGALEYQTQGRVPAQPSAAPVPSTQVPTGSVPAQPPSGGSLAASLGAPDAAPSTGSTPASGLPADALSPISDDVLGPIEHTLTRRELRALRDAHRLRTASTPVIEPSGDLAPQPASSSRLDSAVAEFDALAQAREAAGEDEARPAPRGRRAYAPATNDVAAASPAAAEAQPADETPVVDQPTDVQFSDVQPTDVQVADVQSSDVPTGEVQQLTAAPASFDEDAAFADPALYAQPAEQAWSSEPIPLVEPPAYGSVAPQPVAAPYVVPTEVPQYEQPQSESKQPEAAQPEAEQLETEQPDLEHDPYVVSAPGQEAPAADSPLDAFEALFAPPSEAVQESQTEQSATEPAAEAQTFEHAVYTQPEPVVAAEPESESYRELWAPAQSEPLAFVQPDPPVAEPPVAEQPVYAQPPVAETVYAVPDEPSVSWAAEPPVAEQIAEIVIAEPQPQPEPEPALQAEPEPQIAPERAPVATTTTVTEVELDSDASAPAVGHWSTQAELEDETQQGNAMLAGGVGIGSAPLTTSALVLPSIPDQFGPNTGEVLVTGSISLPESFSATGAHPAQLDQSDLDHMLDPGDHQVASTDSQPVRAIRAVSTHTSSRNVISTTKPKGNRVLTVLIVGAALMAVAVITLLVVGLASGQL